MKRLIALAAALALLLVWQAQPPSVQIIRPTVFAPQPMSPSPVMTASVQRILDAWVASAGATSSPKLTNLAVNSGLNTITALMNSGFLDGYSGSQAATADTAVSGQTCLFSVTFNSTAFGASVAGVATANAITQDSDADATGTAAWFRAYKSDHTACNDATGTRVWDGNIGTTGANLILPTTTISQHGIVKVTSFVLTLSKG